MNILPVLPARTVLTALPTLLLASVAAAQVPTFDDVAVGDVPLDAGGTVVLRSDIYIPAGAATPVPVVVWVHGGGWESGTQNDVPGFALQLLSSGVGLATVGYRVSGQAIFPAQIHDVKGVVRHLRANAALYGIDPTRIACWGASAGAHLATLLATSSAVPELEGTSGGNLAQSSSVLAVVDYFGPTDFLQMNPDVTYPPGSTMDHDAPDSSESRLFGFGGPGEGIGVLRANQSNPLPPFPALMALVTLASPITHLTSDDPPMFIAHGLQDTIAPLAQSMRLVNASLAIGLGPVLKTVQAGGHGFLDTATDAEARAFLLHKFFGITEPVGAPFCFGNASGTACPCGNNSPATIYGGCLNSLGLAGALRASGRASIASDTLVLNGTAMPDSSTLYFQASSAVLEGAGAVFGDGLLCAGSGVVIRLGIQTNVGGASRYPDAGGVPISIGGANLAGETRYYQAWYRDSPAFCTSATFNLTNAVALTFVP